MLFLVAFASGAARRQRLSSFRFSRVAAFAMIGYEAALPGSQGLDHGGPSSYSAAPYSRSRGPRHNDVAGVFTLFYCFYALPHFGTQRAPAQLLSS